MIIYYLLCYYFLQRILACYCINNWIFNYRMGLALYKADFLYPQKKQPNWFPQEDVGPYTGVQNAPAKVKQ